jgi:chemotaxis protein MotB
MQKQQRIEVNNFERAALTVETNTDSPQSIREALADIDSALGVEVMVEEKNLRVRMYADKMFRVSRAELSLEAQAALRAVSMRLRVHTPSHISIAGHTNDEPTDTPQYPNNWYLSSARAIAVGMFLIDETGMDPKLITAQGYGASMPLEQPDKGKNARIEIIVTP